MTKKVTGFDLRCHVDENVKFNTLEKKMTVLYIAGSSYPKNL